MHRDILTCRVTTLESFRFWLHGQNEENEMYNTEERVIENVIGVSVSSPKMSFGSCGHLIIEKPHANRTPTGYQIGKFSFTDTQVAPLVRYAQEHPYMTREVPASKLYILPDFDLIVTGTVDALEGINIRDNKFKFSSFDMQEYIDSAQHRFYMDMLGMKCFYYDFFRVKSFEYPQDCVKAIIEDVESLFIPWNDGMSEEINSLLTDFSDWVQTKGLTKYLVIAPEKMAKIVKGNIELKKLIV